MSNTDPDSRMGGHPGAFSQNDSATPVPVPSTGEAQAFGDWREQLRERVKEIRARKLADKRQPMEARAAIEEPVLAAVGEAVGVGRATPTLSNEVSIGDPQLPATMASSAPDPLPAFEPEEPSRESEALDTGLAGTDRGERRAEIGDVVDALLGPADAVPGPPTDAGTAPEPPPEAEFEALDAGREPEAEPEAEAEAEATPVEIDLGALTAPEPNATDTTEATDATDTTDTTEATEAEDIDEAPLFQSEPTFFEDNPLHDEEADDSGHEPVPGIAPAPLDLDAIPPELQDVEIPAWALPRQRENPVVGKLVDAALSHIDATPIEAPTNTIDAMPVVADDEPPARPADTHLVAEYVSADAPAVETEPQLDPALTDDDLPEATATEDLLNMSVGDLVAGNVPAATEPEAQEPITAHEPQVEPTPPQRLRGLFDPEVEPLVDLDAISAAAAEPSIQDLDGTGEAHRDQSIQWDLGEASDEEIFGADADAPVDPSAPVTDRVFSALADAIVMGTIGILLMVAGASAAGTAVLPFVSAAPLPFLGAWLLFGLAYGIFFIGTCGQTLGKMAMRVRVIGDDDFRVGYGKAAVRTVLYALGTALIGLGLLPALRDPEHRTLHDRLSGTRVVKA